MDFGNILRSLLEENNISQKKLAEDLNMAPSTIGNYIRNFREPDFNTLKRFASYFQVSIDYLLDYHCDTYLNSKHEHDLIRIFSSLSDEYKELLIAQAKLLFRIQKNKKASSPSFHRNTTNYG